MPLTTVAIELALIVLLILANGCLAMSEMAIVSARKTRLQQLAATGDRGAARALELASNPSRPLAAIQIGITLIGIFAGAFGGATLAEELGRRLAVIPVFAPYAEAIGLGLVVVTVTILSLVLGELVPKRIALGNAERVAIRMSGLLRLMTLVARPAVVALSMASDAVLRVLGVKVRSTPPVTEEEVKILVEQGAAAGIFAREEGSIIKRVLALGDRRVGELMTQRLKVIALDVDASFSTNINRILEAPHSYFPVYRGSPDQLIGVVWSKRLLHEMIRRQRDQITIEGCLTQPLFVVDSMPILKLLERFKQTGDQLAFVVDEHGAVAGIVTPTDLMGAILGDLPTMVMPECLAYRRRADGSILLDGAVPTYELGDLFDGDSRLLDDGDYKTLGGFVMGRLGHIPREGEFFEWGAYRFEVLDMDGHRVDKVLAVPIVPLQVTD